jgi:hypothetical protein
VAKLRDEGTIARVEVVYGAQRGEHRVTRQFGRDRTHDAELERARRGRSREREQNEGRSHGVTGMKSTAL